MFRPAALQPDPPLPLLVTGVAGVQGFHALKHFQAKYPGQVIGIRQADNWRLAGEGIVACNAEDAPALERLFEKHRFAAVLNCAGNCALRACELDPRLAWRINVEGVGSLLSIVRTRGSRFVHMSVDLVFSGTAAGGHIESDPTDPVTVYGKTMAAAERLILASYPPACILRISLPMGFSPGGHAGAIDWIQSRFMKSKPATLYFDELRTPTYADCLTDLFAAVLAGDLCGLYHAGGPRRLSLYQIAQIINRVGGYDPDLVMGCPRIAAGPIPPRAGDVTMNSDKLRDALGYQPFNPWPRDDAWVPTHRKWHYDRHGGPGSRKRLAEILANNPGRGVRYSIDGNAAEFVGQ